MAKKKKIEKPEWRFNIEDGNHISRLKVTSPSLRTLMPQIGDFLLGSHCRHENHHYHIYIYSYSSIIPKETIEKKYIV